MNFGEKILVAYRLRRMVTDWGADSLGRYVWVPEPFGPMECVYLGRRVLWDGELYQNGAWGKRFAAKRAVPAILVCAKNRKPFYAPSEYWMKALKSGE